MDQDAEPETLSVAPGSVEAVDTGAAVLVTSSEELAPGLLSMRVSDGDLAAVACPAPTAETWFTGLGARAGHASVIELQNPDVGAAVVDVSFFTRQGPTEVPDLLGVRVPGRSTYVVDLARTVPRRGDVSVRLVVSRGRLSTTVSDRFAPIGSDTDTVDWLAPQPAPAPQALLLGLPAGRGSRRLTLTNPGDDQARVTLKIVTPDSVFAPADLSEVQVRPGALVNVPLNRILAREVRQGALGVLVESTQPVTAGLTSVLGGDLSVSPVPPEVSGTAATILPPGKRTVVIAGAATTGLATLVFRDADGVTLTPEQVELTPGRAFEVAVPDGAAVAVLTVERTTASAVVVIEDEGSVVLPFIVPDEAGLVPAVRPADR